MSLISQKLKLLYYREKALKKGTKPESELWSYINQSKTGYKFTRQAIIEPYRVDFLCYDLKLCIEIDGTYHNKPDQATKDQYRQSFIQAKGFTFLRFTNNQVTNNGKAIAIEIMKHCDNIAKRFNVKKRHIKGRSPCGCIYEKGNQ
ncbi:MAG: endonuclease domain-containing protein [Desulfobulbia bacterium]